MKHELKLYTSARINKEWRIKVKGVMNGIKYNTLVGVSGLLKILGGRLDKLQKFVNRAFECLDDKCACKVYGGPTITFYRK